MIYVQKSNIFENTAVWKDIKNAVFSVKIYSLLEIIYFSYKRFLTQLISFKMSYWTTLYDVPVPSYLGKKRRRKKKKNIPFR
jgi:hypothetical protein